MVDCDTEWMAVEKNLADAVVSDGDILIVASCVMNLVLCHFFITLVGVIASV